MLEKTLLDISKNITISSYKSANPGLKKISRKKLVDIVNKNKLFNTDLTVKGLNLFIKLSSFSNITRNSNFRIKVSNKPIDICMESYEGSILLISIYCRYIEFPYYIDWLNKESEKISLSGIRHKLLT